MLLFSKVNFTTVEDTTPVCPLPIKPAFAPSHKMRISLFEHLGTESSIVYVEHTFPFISEAPTIGSPSPSLLVDEGNFPFVNFPEYLRGMRFQWLGIFPSHCTPLSLYESYFCMGLLFLVVVFKIRQLGFYFFYGRNHAFNSGWVEFLQIIFRYAYGLVAPFECIFS